MSGETVFVVFEPDAPFPVTVCRTPELADAYVAALGRLPMGHPLRMSNAAVDEVPLIDELPEPLRDPEHAPLPPGFQEDELEPSIDTVEGKRFLVAARAAQARLLVELLLPDAVGLVEHAALATFARACDELLDLAHQRDWSNEDGV